MSTCLDSRYQIALNSLLQREGIELGRNTIHRILLRHDLIAAEDRRPPAIERFERSAANELWQMDFKGPKLWYRKGKAPLAGIYS